MDQVPVLLPCRQPEYCPFGHRIRPREFTGGWFPCGCALALEGTTHSGPPGHIYGYCWPCNRDDRQTFHYWPACSVKNGSEAAPRRYR